MKIKIKKLHENAVIPTYSKPGDAGMDLTAVSKKGDAAGNVVYGTGLAVEIPEGHVGLLFPRSSLSAHSLSLANSVGVIDSGYRGEISLKFRPTAQDPFGGTLPRYNVGDRVAQLIIMPFPQVEFEETDTLSTTERGEGGYGSTGK